MKVDEARAALYARWAHPGWPVFVEDREAVRAAYQDWEDSLPRWRVWCARWLLRLSHCQGLPPAALEGWASYRARWEERVHVRQER